MLVLTEPSRLPLTRPLALHYTMSDRQASSVVDSTQRFRLNFYGREAVNEVARGKVTSARAARAASKVLRSGSTGKTSKTAAGSALSQRPPRKSK